MLTGRHLGCAKELFEKGVHPRLFFSPPDIGEMKERVRSGHGKTIFEAVRRRVVGLLKRIPGKRSVVDLALSKEEADRGLAASLSGQSFEIALVGALADDARAVRVVDEILRAIPDSTALAPPEEDNRKSIPYTPYLAYDLLFSEIDSEAAARFREWSLSEAIGKFEPWMERGVYFSAGMNIPLGHCSRALIPSLAIQGDPGVPDLSRAIGAGTRFIQAFCRTGIGPDGFPEEDIGYGSACVVYVTEIGEILYRAGLFNLFEDLRWRKFGRALLHFLQPWGQSMTITGDFGHDPAIGNMALARIAHETQDPTVLWFLNNLDFSARAQPVRLRNGLQVMAHYSSLFYLDVYDLPRRSPQEGKVPTAFCDRGRGIVSLRSSWDKEATYAHIDSSQRHASLMGHWHCSAGHFSLSALGEYFSLDTGRYNCDFDQHSVLLIDGKSPHSTQGEWGGVCVMGRLLDYSPGTLFDSAVIDSSQINDCYWSWRTVGLIKGRGVTPYLWTADDVNKANDFREFWWTLQTHPKNRIRIRGQEATITGFRHGHHLDIGFTYPAAEEYPRPHSLRIEKDILTTSSWKYVSERDVRNQGKRGQRDPLTWSLLRRPRLIAKLSGYNGKLLAVMVPRRKSCAPIRFERLKTNPNTLAMKIHFPKVTDTLLFAYEHGFLDAEDISGIGDFLVVRRDRETGKVIDYALRGGEALTIGGRRFSPKSKLH